MKMRGMYDTKWRDVFIGVSMFVFALFAFLSALNYGFPVWETMLYVFAIGSIPWVIYNILAEFLGWEKSHVFDLLWYWLDVLFTAIP